ncbi:MAG: DUF4147 domain-containing protein, partial [Anaerolineae bacterium]
MDEAVHLLRQHAWQMIRAALRAVDPAEAVQRHMCLDDDTLLLYETPEREEPRAYDLREFDRIIVVGGGKAVTPMARTIAAM